MQLAKPLETQAARLAEELRTDVDVGAGRAAASRARCEIAGAGFLNIRVEAGVKLASRSQQALDARARASAARRRRSREKVQVEFVSANPTGPLHVGHGRQAALGDALAALLESQGHAVTREFYYNDAGAQIQNLALSVQARAQGHRARRRRAGRRTAMPASTSRTSPRNFARKRSGRSGCDPQVRGGLPAQGAGRRPAGVRREVRRLLPRVEPVHRRQGRRGRSRAWSRAARPTRRTARCGCAPPTTATTRTAWCASPTAATPTSCPTSPITSPSGSAASAR